MQATVALSTDFTALPSRQTKETQSPSEHLHLQDSVTLQPKYLQRFVYNFPIKDGVWIHGRLSVHF